MENYNVVDARETEDFTITHKIVDTDGDSKILEYSSIRAGLSWPVGSTPAYCCILGEERLDIDYRDRKKHRGKLKFFAEYENPSLSLDNFFRRLTDDTVRLYCKNIYTDVEENESFMELYQNYVSREEIKVGRLEQAPYANNFVDGIYLINDWINSGKLELPEDSIARNQLREIESADLDESPETKYFAINALRYAIGAFHKFRANQNAAVELAIIRNRPRIY